MSNLCRTNIPSVRGNIPFVGLPTSCVTLNMKVDHDYPAEYSISIGRKLLLYSPIYDLLVCANAYSNTLFAWP